MESDNTNCSPAERFANFGAIWILVLAAAAPVVFWRIGEPIFGCIISPLVVIICALPLSPIVLLEGWKKILFNWHSLALAVVCFFWLKHGGEIISGPFRASVVTSPVDLISDVGKHQGIADYLPFAGFDKEIVAILQTRLVGERVGRGDIRDAGREIVSRGYARSNCRKLDKWERVSRSQKYGNWGGRNPEMDGLDYSSLLAKFQD